jgi:two-component system phosphate regulon response regulator PhoB
MNAEAKPRVIVVDDEPDVTELLDYRLKQAGYSVMTLNNPLQFVSTVREFAPNLFIFDIMMPELSGLQLARMVRGDAKIKHLPILLLTARNEAEDRIKGLETGADDYLAKPFDVRELLLRVQRLLERSQSKPEAEEPHRVQIGGLIIDDQQHEIMMDGEAISLTATEFRLLKLLMARKGRVQTREHLLVSVWQYDAEIETRTVDTHIRRLREKLGSYADMIETIRGVGYRFIDPDRTKQL